jgi:ferredoxin-fold anticodon binding domain-containing protein
MASEQRSERRLANAFRDLRDFFKENESLSEFTPLLPEDLEALRSYVVQFDTLALKNPLVDQVGRQSNGWKQLVNDAVILPRKRSERGKKSALNMAAVEHFIEEEISALARWKLSSHLSKIALVALSVDQWRDLFDLIKTLYDEIVNGETELSEAEEEEDEKKESTVNWCATGRPEVQKALEEIKKKAEEEKEVPATVTVCCLGQGTDKCSCH